MPTIPIAPGDAPHALAINQPRSYMQLIVSRAMQSCGARAGAAWVAIMVLAAVFAPLVANSHPLLMKQGGVWSSPLVRHLTLSDVLIFIAAILAAVMLSLTRLKFSQRVLAWATMMGLIIPASWTRDSLVPFFTRWSLSEYGEPLSLGVWLVVLTGFAIYAAVLTGVLVGFVRTQGLRWWFKASVLVVASLIMAWLIIWPIRPPAVVVYDQYREAEAEGKIEWKLDTPLPFSPADRLRDQENMRLVAPSRAHPMGTTNNGADLASNMIYASRIALSIGFISTGIAVCVGIVIGGLMGYFSGWVDLFGMRLVEIFSAIPTFILLLTFVAAFGANLYIMMVIIGLTGWVGDAIFIRAEFLRLRKQDFVQAAIATGLPLRSVLFRHMLPNGIAPVLVSASFGVAAAILAESSLSFLGIGLKEEASWGRLLNDALGSGGTFYWWLALYPGLAIFITVFAYNLVGEAMRDAIDPHLQKAAQI